MNQLDQCVIAMSKGNTELKTLGLKKAQTEKIYRIRQAQEILKLRTEKLPVTLIMDLVKGNEEIAQLRLEKSVAESSYFTCISAIDNLKIEIDVVRSKLAFMKVEMQNS